MLETRSPQKRYWQLWRSLHDCLHHTAAICFSGVKCERWPPPPSERGAPFAKRTFWVSEQDLGLNTWSGLYSITGCLWLWARKTEIRTSDWDQTAEWLTLGILTRKWLQKGSKRLLFGSRQFNPNFPRCREGTWWHQSTCLNASTESLGFIL